MWPGSDPWGPTGHLWELGTKLAMVLKAGSLEEEAKCLASYNHSLNLRELREFGGFSMTLSYLKTF